MPIRIALLLVLASLLTCCGDDASTATPAADIPDTQAKDTQLSDDAGDVPDSTAGEDPTRGDAGGISVVSEDGSLEVENGRLSLVCGKAGTCELLLSSGEVVVRRAWSRVVAKTGPWLSVTRSSSPSWSSAKPPSASGVMSTSTTRAPAARQARTAESELGGRA